MGGWNWYNKVMSNYEATTKEGKCIFCGIVTGTIPVAGKFWENEEFMAFLAIDPNTEGFHVLFQKSIMEVMF
jgi:diadenosine tetraphosphate (Ap4A) HIT family hydrolase